MQDFTYFTPNHKSYGTCSIQNILENVFCHKNAIQNGMCTDFQIGKAPDLPHLSLHRFSSEFLIHPLRLGFIHKQHQGLLSSIIPLHSTYLVKNRHKKKRSILYTEKYGIYNSCAFHLAFHLVEKLNQSQNLVFTQYIGFQFTSSALDKKTNLTHMSSIVCHRHHMRPM